MPDDPHVSHPTLRPSGTFQPEVIEDIQAKAESGLYRIRGYGTLRPRNWATFDDLTFLPCSLTRIPLEGYREKCSTKTVLGKRHARKPIVLDIPVMITGMRLGSVILQCQGGPGTRRGHRGIPPTPPATAECWGRNGKTARR